MRPITGPLVSPLVLACVLAGGTAPMKGEDVRVSSHEGMCSASAAVAAGPSLFIVASDEDNRLRIYRSDRPGGPVYSRDMSAFLGIGRDHEADIEGATWLDGKVYWIGSHARDKDGELRPQRQRLFATELKGREGDLKVSGVGKPYEDLLGDLSRDPRFASYRLTEGGALNIEGLAATPDHSLLVAFRSPLIEGRALIVPLRNPAGVIRGRAARFGDPVTLDLGGLGVRGIEYSDSARAYLLLAGPPDGEGPRRLYRWAGGRHDVPSIIAEDDFAGLNPEAVIVFPGRERALILSDDDGRRIDGRDCKDLKAAKDRRFRSIWVDVTGRNRDPVSPRDPQPMPAP